MWLLRAYPGGSPIRPNIDVTATHPQRIFGDLVLEVGWCWWASLAAEILPPFGGAREEFLRDKSSQCFESFPPTSAGEGKPKLFD